MSKMRQTPGKQVQIKVGDISGTSGAINIAGGNVTTSEARTGLTADEIDRLFGEIYSAIDARSELAATQQEDLKAEVRDVQSAVEDATTKKIQIDESFLARHFRNIARMAPDILDVVVATLANPLAGLGVAAKKIAAKAKEEAASS